MSMGDHLRINPPQQPDSRGPSSATLVASREFAQGAGAARVVITQPMYFPWVGILEQARLADVFVHYDDVQLASRSFSNRVQVKTSVGAQWLTVPIRRHSRGCLINEVEVDYRTDWQRSHKDKLKQAYSAAPFKSDMLDLVEQVISIKYNNLAELSIATTMSLLNYFSLNTNKTFFRSRDLKIGDSSTRRLVNICGRLQARAYLTGHGAKNYLQHEAFEAEGIDVEYIDYGMVPYPQLHGPFTPYVTALDLVAHCGRDGAANIAGKPIAWRDFLASNGRL